MRLIYKVIAKPRRYMRRASAPISVDPPPPLPRNNIYVYVRWRYGETVCGFSLFLGYSCCCCCLSVHLLGYWDIGGEEECERRRGRCGLSGALNHASLIVLNIFECPPLLRTAILPRDCIEIHTCTRGGKSDVFWKLRFKREEIKSAVFFSNTYPDCRSAPLAPRLYTRKNWVRHRAHYPMKLIGLLKKQDEFLISLSYSGAAIFISHFIY